MAKIDELQYGIKFTKCCTCGRVEVEQIEKVKQEILQQIDMFIAEYDRIGYHGSLAAMETARRLVNAALTDLCSCGERREGE